jgi:hypothetical protein
MPAARRNYTKISKEFRPFGPLFASYKQLVTFFGDPSETVVSPAASGALQARVSWTLKSSAGNEEAVVMIHNFDSPYPPKETIRWEVMVKGEDAAVCSLMGRSCIIPALLDVHAEAISLDSRVSRREP